jgi:hypothetical protein
LITASTDELLWYLADLIWTMERYGAVLISPDDPAEVAWIRDGDVLTLDLDARLPAARYAAPTELRLQERWHGDGDQWLLAEYGYELCHRGLDYRRALHRHDVDRFVRAHGVASHEHCESTMGVEACRHCAAEPVDGARQGFFRLYGLWLDNVKPDCSVLRCLD